MITMGGYFNDYEGALRLSREGYFNNYEGGNSNNYEGRVL